MQELTHDENIIELADISFSYGSDTVLQDFSFNIHRGDYLGVIGPNGGGKTTLLKIILGLLKPQHGEVKLFGVSQRNFQDWNKIGYVSQKATQIDENFPMTVEGVVGMGRYGKKKPFQFLNAHDRDMVSRSLASVEMLDYRTRLIGNLSGGQQQRVFIARALAGEPEIMILDEPTSGLDAKTQEQFYPLLRKLNQEFGITLIISSHDLESIEREATELICINRTLVYCGLPKEFRAHENFAQLYKFSEPFTHH